MRDPLVQPATPAQVAAVAAAKGMSAEKAAGMLEAARERQLAAQARDPFNYGYEPPIWFVVKSLMRNPVWSDYERKRIAKRLGSDVTAEGFAEAMRKRLGFEYPVTKVLIMGSNRSGKTDFSAKLCMQSARLGNKYIGSGAQTHKTQKQNQMARVWHYMPNDWKAKNIATKRAMDAVENISYTPKNGFAGSKITFDNGSILNFLTYEQSIASQEGVEYDLVHLDEEYGIEHYNLMTTRITSRAGMFLGTFTPLHGYTPQIAKFLEGAKTVRWHQAYLRPKDGGEKWPWAELNLEREEYEGLVEWRKTGQSGDCGIRESTPEDCFEWLFDGGDGKDNARSAGGRVFDFTPRVAICQGGQAAAVWFYGSDNPYGLPSELIATKMADENAEQRILESVYGVARDMKGRIFKTFTRERNVIPPEALPAKLVRMMVVDPAPERNWCMAWFGLDPDTGVLYLYREWPGNYEIPGQGTPGAWVVPSDKNGGLNDGARGDGQTTFGFGYNQIKFEIARLEGWADYLEWARELGGGPTARSGAVATREWVPAGMPEDISMVDDWGEQNGVAEVMTFRLLDSRAASQSKIAKGSNRLLIEDMEDLMDGWAVADGQRCEVGYNVLIDKFASGKLRVVENCTNAIACIEMLTGKDGQKGAAKDFVDLIRYAVMSDIWNYGPEMATEVGASAAMRYAHLRLRGGGNVYGGSAEARSAGGIGEVGRAVRFEGRGVRFEGRGVRFEGRGVRYEGRGVRFEGRAGWSEGRARRVWW